MGSVRQCLHFLCAVAGAVSVSPLVWVALAAAPASPPVLQNARERVVFVTAVNRDDGPVTDLSVRDVDVREDGVQREVLRVERAEGPMTIALLVDNSTAAESFIADYRKALQAFVNRVAGEHSVAIITFADRPTTLVDFTTSKAALLQGIDRLFPAPESGAYFLDAVRETSKKLAARDFERAALVAIATDGPEFSDWHYSQVLPELKASGASLSVLALHSGGTRDLRDEGHKNRATLFDEGARATGGTRVELLNSMTLPTVLGRVADQLLNQYRVTYARPGSLIPPEKVAVSAVRDGIRLRGTPMKIRGE